VVWHHSHREPRLVENEKNKKSSTKRGATPTSHSLHFFFSFRFFGSKSSFHFTHQFHLLTSFKMARTKQYARKSTGGKNPANKAARKCAPLIEGIRSPARKQGKGLGNRLGKGGIKRHRSVQELGALEEEDRTTTRRSLLPFPPP
jgi:hypothetical protein